MQLEKEMRNILVRVLQRIEPLGYRYNKSRFIIGIGSRNYGDHD